MKSEAQKLRDYAREVYESTREISRMTDTVWMAAVTAVIKKARREAVSEFAYSEYGR